MQSIDRHPIHLTILRRGDTNIVDLDEVDALIPRSETQVDGAFLQEIAEEVVRLTAPGYNRGESLDVRGRRLQEPEAAVQDLQRIGSLIYSHLLTEPARKKLRAATPCNLYLRLDEQLIHVPWELCYDGKEFLATKFHVGRQVITGYPIPTLSAKRTVTGTLRVLLVVDPTESLPEAGREAEQLSTLLDNIPGVEVTLMGGRGARKVPLLAALQNHDVVHFAGHSYYDPTNPSRSGWRLAEGILTAGELSKLTTPPLLVFSNSCQAGATSGWKSGYHYEGHAFGIGSAFLMAGVRNYIGTFWVVHDEESALFAATFYQGVVDGLSLGEAQLRARHEIIRQRGWKSLTWASYMLYGDPAFTLFTPEEPSSLPAVSPSQQPVGRVPQETTRPHLVFTEPVRRVGLLFNRTTQIVLLCLSVFVSGLLLSRLFPTALWSEKNGSDSLLSAYERAFADLHQGQIDKALATFQQLVATPDNALGLGYDGLAAIYFAKGKLTEAKTAIQQATTRNPHSVIALLTQGDLAFSMGDREKATAAYLQATQSENKQGWQAALAYNALGVSYALEGAKDKAQNAFARAFQEDIHSVDAASNLGYLAWITGNATAATRWLEKAKSLQPDDEYAQIFLEWRAADGKVRTQATSAPKILLVPFSPGGGNLRRLGEGEALAWRLAQALAVTFPVEIAQRETIPNLTLEDQTQAVISLRTFAKEKGATHLIWGEYQRLGSQLNVFGQIVSTKHEATQRFRVVADGTTTAIATAALDSAGKITQSIEK
jgi:CHAT domain-containing protein/tetratricopeptide (TPR) repeat protein